MKTLALVGILPNSPDETKEEQKLGKAEFGATSGICWRAVGRSIPL